MKRGLIVLTQELLKEILKDKIPDDFKLSAIKFEIDYNTIKLYGYSDEFPEIAENAIPPAISLKNNNWPSARLKKLD